MMAATTKPMPVDVGSRFVSVTEAAQRSELPRSVISGWIDSKIVRSLKVGTGQNCKRIVDVHDLLAFRDQSLMPSMPRMLAPGCRALLYTRVDNDTVGDADAEMERVHDCFFAHMQQQHPALAASTLYRCAEVGQQADLNRPGFLRLMALIFARDIDVLLVTSADQLCDPLCMPLLAWILERNHVSLHTEALPPLFEHEAGHQPGLLTP
jgi:hypothetical protein